jgi:hypothetical protein
LIESRIRLKRTIDNLSSLFLKFERRAEGENIGEMIGEEDVRVS